MTVSHIKKLPWENSYCIFVSRNDQHLQSQEASKDNIDSVIKIVNGENQIGIELNSKSEPEETRNSEENTTTSRVQYLFQKLLSG